MPDNFGQKLREGSARFSEGLDPDPVRLVRARGDRRRRRRTAAGSVAISVAVIACAIGGWYGFSQPGRTVAPVNPRPVTSSAAPSPTSAPTGRPGGGPTSSASAPAAQTAPASTASSGYSALAGQWKQTDGAGEALYIFSDGTIGFGEAGGAYYPMCAGELQPSAVGAYPFTAACGPATSGTMTLADGTLTIHIPGNANGAGSTVTWVPVSGRGAPGNLQVSVPPSWLVGTWTITKGDNGDESFTVAPSGAVTWSLVGQQGKTVSGTGTVQLVAGWGYRIATSFGSPSVPGVWPILHPDDGQLVLIGGMGALDFHQTRVG
jgi:hypothetical protein